MSELTKLSAAYQGNDPYIFISYAHRDSERVLPIVDRLLNEGFRVWFDVGIIPGKPWDDNIADKLRGSECVLAFISKAYLASTNCRDEIAMARAERKKMAMIYLEDVELTPGMLLRYNRLQALFRHRSDDNEFYEKLFAVDGVTVTKEG